MYGIVSMFSVVRMGIRGTDVYSSTRHLTVLVRFTFVQTTVLRIVVCSDPLFLAVGGWRLEKNEP